MSQNRNFFNRPISYRLVATVLLLTALMTALFWRIGQNNVSMHGQRQESLRDLRNFDILLERHVDAMRVFRFQDSAQFQLVQSLFRDFPVLLGQLSEGEMDSSAMSKYAQIEIAISSKQHLVSKLAKDRYQLGLRIAKLRQQLLLDVQSSNLCGLEVGMLDTLGMILAGNYLDLPKLPDPALGNGIRIEYSEVLLEAVRQQAGYRRMAALQVGSLAEELAVIHKVRANVALEANQRFQQVFYGVSLLLILAVTGLFARVKFTP